MINAENVNSIKETTLKMYESTISEMKEKGIDTSKIEKEYEDTKEAYEHPEEFNKNTLEKPINLFYPQKYDGYKCETIAIEPKIPENCGFLMQNLFIVRFFDVPEHLIRRVLFVNDNKMKIGFYETSGFCVYDYIKKNKKKLNGTFSIEYVDRIGSLLRIDTYELKSINKIKQFQLDYTSGCPVYVEIELKYKNHGISTK